MPKHERTLAAIFKEPAPANLKWSAIEALLRASGASISEGSGSRVRVELHGRRAVFHRPHPDPQASRPVVRAVRQFLDSAGIQP